MCTLWRCKRNYFSEVEPNWKGLEAATYFLMACITNHSSRPARAIIDTGSSTAYGRMFRISIRNIQS
ncbi:hypothetical protein KIN20_034090 [Parelaphostrongylus tenuis]|uniref:Uncharacterized protein n=1 Tax=Parelaphostrongylus tenuis TaxID=148309 RepID=A0AAD5R9S6_PARTN|nr:hypothetical protein KIN20_034090 [Parelaphostrongylus tenuis]